MERCAIKQAGVVLVRQDCKDEKHRFGNLAGIRRWIESVNDTLKRQLDLERQRRAYPSWSLIPFDASSSGSVHGQTTVK